MHFLQQPHFFQPHIGCESVRPEALVAASAFVATVETESVRTEALSRMFTFVVAMNA